MNWDLLSQLIFNRMEKLSKSSLNTYDARSAFIYAREAQYAVGLYEPGSGATGLPILRISKDAIADYELPTDLSKVSFGTGAVLNNDAFVLLNSRLFRLGETSAEEVDLNMPSDWEGSKFEFVGYDAYFYHAYIKETNRQKGSRVWAWNQEEVGLLMADDTKVVTDFGFYSHIGNDIYFYGEDEATGWALRKIPAAVINRPPRLAKVTGSWFDPATSGQGLVLHPVDEDRTDVSYYGFEDDGSPLWLTGVSGEMLEIGKTTTVALNVTSGGNFGSFTPDQITNVPWGILDLTFDTCTKGTAVFSGPNGQQTMNMMQLTGVEGISCFYVLNPPKPKTAGITGSWYDPTTSGQGLILHSMSDEQMVVSFYGYNNDSERMWLIGLYNGLVAWGEPLEMPMTVTTGGNFGDFDPNDITRTEWGTLTINFVDCNNATAMLDGLDGQQTMNMVKLAGLQGSEMDCR